MTPRERSYKSYSQHIACNIISLVFFSTMSMDKTNYVYGNDDIYGSDKQYIVMMTWGESTEIMRFMTPEI